MSFGQYMRARVWEWLLCVAVAAALAYTCCSGFYAAQPAQAMPWALAGVCAVLLAGLFAVAYNARTATWGGVAYGVVVLVVLGVAAATSAGATLVDDVEGNYFIVALCVLLPTLATFGLSRGRVGCVVLLAVGVLVCELVEYLYWYGHVVALCVFLAAGVGLLVHQGYRKRLDVAATPRLAFGAAGGAACALAVVALLVGAGVYVAGIAPLDPPHAVVKLFVEHRSVQEIEIRGTGASEAADGSHDGNTGHDEQPDAGEDAQDNPVDTVQSSLARLLGMAEDQTGNEGTTTALVVRVVLGLIIAALVALLVVAAIVVRRVLRRRALRRMCAGEPAQAVGKLYRFFLGRFAKLKLARDPLQTPLAYCQDQAQALTNFETEGGLTREGAHAAALEFADLTWRYMRAEFGGGQATSEDVEVFTRYYNTFYRRARHFIGTPRYCLKYFTL